MIGPSDRLLAGVSGGADSVCLALVLRELGYEMAIAHLNHGLRGAESDADEEFTRRLARQLGVEFFVRKITLARNSAGIEAAGRTERKEFFRELLQDRAFTKIAVAHNRNDRVETFLLNLLRGSGTEGLSSMSPVSQTTIRPLIQTGRDAIETYLKGRNQTWRTDSTNSDLEFARNRVRHVVLPSLASGFNPNVVETLTRTLEILDDENAWIGHLTDEWLEWNGTKENDDFVISAEALAAEPIGLIRRVLRTSLLRAGSNLQDVTFGHIEAIRGLLEEGKSGKVIEVPGGLQATREFERLVFGRGIVSSATEYEYRLEIPGNVVIPELGKVFTAEIIDGEGSEVSGKRVFVDAESIGPYVRIRNWKPGDYYKPVGLPAGKLKKLFQRARIPRSHRTGWPVVVADSTIVWVASFPVSREFAPCGRSQKIVVFEALQS